MSRLHPMRRLCAAALFALPCGVTAATLDCPDATTLEALVDCISLQMPQHDSGDYRAPNATQQTALADAARAMLEGECAAPLPSTIASTMRRFVFTDSVDQRSYCVLMEVADELMPANIVDRGWGTFIVYPDALRQLSHQAPHPKFDSSTSGSDQGDARSEREAIRIFKATDSRTYLMCGARRSANLTASSCQSEYYVADCAHNTDNLLHIATRVMNEHYAEQTQDWTAIQWHTMGSSCSGVEAYLSAGFSTAPEANSKVTVMRERFKALRSSYDIIVPGSGNCTLNATENTAGRMLNGVAVDRVCASSTGAAASHKFMHIEQRSSLLGDDLEGWAADWADAVVHTFRTAPPAAPVLHATAGEGSVQLSWNAASEATGYTVKRATASGGPYSAIHPAAGNNNTATAYADSGRSNGTTYYYIVSAINDRGSADSNEAAATPAGALKLTPAMDAYVRGGSNADKTYDSSELQARTASSAGNNRQAFMKFDLTQVAGATSATLRLKADLSGSGDSLNLEVREVSSTAWTESGATRITWNNKPAMGGLLGSATIAGTAANWYEVDVTAYVQAAKNAGKSAIAFGLASPTGSSRHIVVRSRNASSANRPQLAIVP